MATRSATATTGALPEPPLRAGPRKLAAVQELEAKLGRATSAIVTDYRGLTVAQLEELRSLLRAQDIEYVVVKNTLARRAAVAAGVGEFSEVLVGPVGLAIGYGDLAAPARVLTEYHRVHRRLPVMAGLVEGHLTDARGVQAISELPSREVLQSQLAGTLQAPLNSLAGALASLLDQFAGALDARRAELEAA
ncbi:MAG TPA: 50S ribosomal protein L10 [Candidatus Dormibacteraeota bacterium]